MVPGQGEIPVTRRREWIAELSLLWDLGSLPFTRIVEGPSSLTLWYPCSAGLGMAWSSSRMAVKAPRPGPMSLNYRVGWEWSRYLGIRDIDISVFGTVDPAQATGIKHRKGSIFWKGDLCVDQVI